MKRIIFLLACIAFFTSQGKAFVVSHTVESKSGHKYAFYNCNQRIIRYELQIEIKKENIYGFAAATAYFSNNTSKCVQLFASSNYTGLYRSANFIAPDGRKIIRVKIAASGETKSIPRSPGQPETVIARGWASVAW